ncbi:MAG: hydrogenase iron-sulfur subunit [Proteobacteria bacterium]|nr:hydrogenase iron-sulfur subunit [Pseudomonadota bacterium]
MARSEMITSLLEDFGVDPQRFQINWVSSAEPDKFVAAVKQVTERVKKLGPHKSEAAHAA